MSETHEERTLGELLKEIAGEDVSIEAPREIEQRVMAYWDAPGRHRNSRPAYWVAAALAAGLLVALALPRSPGRIPKPLGPPSPPAPQAISPPVPAGERVATSSEAGPGPAGAHAERPTPAARQPSRALRGTRAGFITRSGRLQPGLSPPEGGHYVGYETGSSLAGAFSGGGNRGITAAVTEPRREVLNFVPLVPFADQEPIGSFQLVRIRLSRAALGEFGAAWDLNQPADSVQADVLLGEDGLARAIRVTSDSTDGYLWRSR